MRNQWRLLLRRYSTISAATISKPLSLHQVHATSPPPPPLATLSLSSLGRPLTNCPLLLPSPFQNPTPRCFSSELALDDKLSDYSVIINIFSKSISSDEIQQELESNNIIISHESVLNVLRNLESSPVTAVKFFDWVLKREGERLSSKSYNLMLGILGVNGYVKEFWDMVETMKKKGYGVSKGAFTKVSEYFENVGLESDLEKLRGLFASKSLEDDSVEKVSYRICKIVRQEVWDEDVEKKIKELNVALSSDLVKMVLENLQQDPTKASIFFRWVEESGLFNHDEWTYNSMAVILGREDCIDRFWNVVNQMRNAGHEMEMGAYVKVMSRFIKRKLMKDAVELYEFAMGGKTKPSDRDFTFLLKKIVVGKELDTELIFKLVKIFKDSGNVLTNSTMNSVLKSLTSVGRIKDCNKIMDFMMEGGLRPSASLQRKTAILLSTSGSNDEPSKFIENLEAFGCTPGFETWTSLVEGHCLAGNLDIASECLQKLIEKDGVSSAGYALQVLVSSYCSKNRAAEACKLLCDMVRVKGLKPSHLTFKTLINNLLVQGAFKDALDLLPVMKDQGFPPYLDALIEYISKHGNADDAIIFLKAMTTKKFPSTAVFLRIFEAFFMARRLREAQNLLAKCPRHIKNHADILNRFSSIKSAETGTAAAVAS
ncbi:hypothetical protein Nepgr_029093 [Nepenthes gracilis]|uniref:Pentatricopeptide repeat-containing protein n=1 Tax=Nepenthes gracilis TaxID=150966 RepID=A0AAD3TCY3_NEPGR|nr:hypothetical protein Nepgr_029093 [Nepenthes gracilis]